MDNTLPKRPVTFEVGGQSIDLFDEDTRNYKGVRDTSSKEKRSSSNKLRFTPSTMENIKRRVSGFLMKKIEKKINKYTNNLDSNVMNVKLNINLSDEKRKKINKKIERLSKKIKRYENVEKWIRRGEIQGLSRKPLKINEDAIGNIDVVNNMWDEFYEALNRIDQMKDMKAADIINEKRNGKRTENVVGGINPEDVHNTVEEAFSASNTDNKSEEIASNIHEDMDISFSVPNEVPESNELHFKGTGINLDKILTTNISNVTSKGMMDGSKIPYAFKTKTEEETTNNTIDDDGPLYDEVFPEFPVDEREKDSPGFNEFFNNVKQGFVGNNNSDLSDIHQNQAQVVADVPYVELPVASDNNSNSNVSVAVGDNEVDLHDDHNNDTLFTTQEEVESAIGDSTSTEEVERIRQMVYEMAEKRKQLEEEKARVEEQIAREKREAEEAAAKAAKEKEEATRLRKEQIDTYMAAYQAMVAANKEEQEKLRAFNDKEKKEIEELRKEAESNQRARQAALNDVKYLRGLDEIVDASMNKSSLSDAKPKGK